MAMLHYLTTEGRDSHHQSVHITTIDVNAVLIFADQV